VTAVPPRRSARGWARDISWLHRQPNTIDNLTNALAGEAADLFHQITHVKRKYPADIYDALLGQVSLTLFPKNTSWSFSASQISSDSADNHCVNTTSIENVILDNNVRTKTARR